MREKYRKYKLLRRNYYAVTLVPVKGTKEAQQIIASMGAMDATEDYLHFRALNEEIDVPVKEAYIERIKRTRELAIVNKHAQDLWGHKKWSLSNFLQEYLVFP